MVGGGVVVLQPGSDWRCQLSEHLSLEADSITATPGKVLAADGAAGGAEVVWLQTGGPDERSHHFRQTRSPLETRSDRLLLIKLKGRCGTTLIKHTASIPPLMLTERKVGSSEVFQTVLMLMLLPSSGRTVDRLKKEFAKL